MKLYKPGREQKRLGAEVYFMFKARKTPEGKYFSMCNRKVSSFITLYPNSSWFEGAEYFFDVIAIGTFRQVR